MTAILEIKSLLKVLGFKPEEGATSAWVKSYTNHAGYIIRVIFDDEIIDYGDKITLGDKTTSNFKSSENFVVLECVNRLLEKGYKPERIVLEKDYPLGHKTKGKLDVLVLDDDDKAFLMIECKTSGAEYIKATKKTLADGGQLLSYFQQDKSAQYLCLYTSHLEGNKAIFLNGIIKVEPTFIEATNSAEVFEKWNKNLRDNGLFDTDSLPYNITIRALTKDRLTPLTKEDSSRIFNQFAEILRHNVVSDKPNAFNKLITLLLCKIVDEDLHDQEELHFQWFENDTPIDLQKRLNDLYKKGMKKYLTKEVTDFSDKDVEDIVGLNEAQKDIIKQMMTELRLKKNNEFAFKEVFNDASFADNSKVLKEVVELLQPYQVRYNRKHQFLGDFFELLLNTSIKQEAGQFFTPVPLARFIINSIPIKELVTKKINDGESDFLPYVIDYAVGSGHFLTEAMDEIHKVLQEIKAEKISKTGIIKRNIDKWADDYDWAYDFVYGIEKDYRLVKTAKVSCFLNGDGLARIFNADGLGNFSNNEDYQDKLKVPASSKGSKDNQQFEILIANPPYSVSSFKNTLVNGDKSFELYSRLTDESSEIECLFVERAKQLLKENGYAGIILPSSILNNTGIYSDAREIIFKYFKIVAIAEFGSSTFMATGTNTVTLFLQRRNNSDWQKIQHSITDFFKNGTDVTVNEIEKAYSKYVNHVFKSISLIDYISFVKQNANSNLLNHEIFVEYRKAFDSSTPIKNLKSKSAFKRLTEKEQQAELTRLFYENVREIEKDKLLYFLLAYSQNTLLIKSNPDGKNDTEKGFLGYDFSGRRGHEGIKPFGARTIQEATKLYDENNSFNDEKVNSYILNSFLGKEVDINEKVREHIYRQRLIDMMQFDRNEFTKSISLAVKKKSPLITKWPLKPLGEICNVKIGGTPDRNNSEYYINGNNLWVSISEMKGNVITDTKEKINDLGVEHSNVKLITAGTTLLSFKLSIGRTAIAGKDLYTNEAIAGLEIKEEYKNKLLDDYLFCIFNARLIDLEKSEFNAFGKSLNSEFLKMVKIPLPDKDVQKLIIKNIAKIEKNATSNKKKIDQLISDIYKAIDRSTALCPISSIADLRKEKVDPQAHPDEKYNYIGLEHIESNTGKILPWNPVVGAQIQSTKNVFKKGDLLYGKLRPYLNKVYEAEFDGICSTDIVVLKSNHSKILKYILLHENFVSAVSSLMKGVSLPRLQVDDFLQHKIKFPLKDTEAVLKRLKEIENEILIVEKSQEDIQSQKEAAIKELL